MNADKITFVINGNTYSISANDPKAISSIKAPDKKALLTLLESLKQQQAVIEQRANQQLAQAAIASSAGISTIKPNATVLSNKPQKAERLGRGDADALMAKLIMEERAKQKSIPNQSSFYKWIFGISAAIIIFIFVL